MPGRVAFEVTDLPATVAIPGGIWLAFVRDRIEERGVMERVLLAGWNLVALAAAGLILANLVVANGNSRLARETAALRRQVEERRPAEALLRQVTQAVAEGAVKDAALRALLAKHKLKATVMVDGAAREMP